jgi:hypothetical protein
MQSVAALWIKKEGWGNLSNYRCLAPVFLFVGSYNLLPVNLQEVAQQTKENFLFT